MQDAANLLTGPESKKHKAALEGIDESKLEYTGLKVGAVDLHNCLGYVVKAPYIIYNAKEFVKEHGLDVAKVNSIDPAKGKQKLNFVTIKNERGKKEDVVLARRGPRKLDVMFFTGVKMSEAIMEQMIRKGQTSATFNWATAPEQHQALDFHKRFARMPTAQQLKEKAAQAVKVLEKGEKDAEAGGARDSVADAAPSQAIAGLQMPGDEEESTKPIAKAKSKGARRISVDSPATKKARQGSAMSAAVAEGSIGAPKGMALSCGRVGASQDCSAGSARGTSVAPSEGIRAEGKSASGSGRYLNFMGALTGELKRQVLNGAKRTLATLVGDTNEYNRLEREITGFTHCLNLAPEKLRACTFASMVKDMSEARKCIRSLEFPLPVMLKLCEKYAVGIIKRELFAEFGACIRIWHSKRDRKFSESAPHYGALIAQRCNEAETFYQAAISVRDAFFSNEVSDLFSEPIDQKCSGLGLPYQMAEAILSEYKKLLEFEDDSLLTSMPEDLCTVFDMVMTACRAIVAVSSPVPGLYGSSSADVQKVFIAENAGNDEVDEEFLDLFGSDAEQGDQLEGNRQPVKSCMDECFERLRTAAYKNAHWKARMTAYPVLGAEDASISNEYHEIVEALQQPPVEAATVTNAVEKCKAWSPKLRQGACSLIYHKLQSWALSVAAEAKGDNDLAALVCRVATLCDPRGRHAGLQGLKTSLEKHLQHTQSELALSHLRALVQSPTEESSNIEEVSAALGKCKGLAIHSDLAHELVSFQDWTISRFVDAMKATLRQSPAWDARCDNSNDVILAIGKFEAVQALGAQGDVASWSEVKAFARQCVELKDLVSGVIDNADATGDLEDGILAALAAHASIKAKLASNVAAGLGSLPYRIAVIHEHVAEFFAEKDQQLFDKIQDARQALRKELALARGRLLKVEGGKDDSTSWKAGLDQAGTLQDAKEELMVLRDAYVDAIKKRIAATRAVHPRANIHIPICFSARTAHATLQAV